MYFFVFRIKLPIEILLQETPLFPTMAQQIVVHDVNSTKSKNLRATFLFSLRISYTGKPIEKNYQQMGLT